MIDMSNGTPQRLPTIQFKKLSEDAKVPTTAHYGDAGWDLYTSCEIIIPPHSFCDVHVDIAVALPRGIWAMITGRSSTIRTYKLRVETAIIDNGYRGEMYVGVWNHNDEEIIIEKGVRLAQLILFKLIPATWVEKDSLPPSERGDRGFGHSGK